MTAPDSPLNKNFDAVQYNKHGATCPIYRTDQDFVAGKALCFPIRLSWSKTTRMTRL
jgi:hypothetical protein